MKTPIVNSKCCGNWCFMVTWFLNFKLSKLLSLPILKICSSSTLRAKYWTFVWHLFAPKKIHRTTATSRFFRNFVTIQKNTTPHRIDYCMLAISVDHTGKISLKLGPLPEKLNRNVLFIGARLKSLQNSWLWSASKSIQAPCFCHVFILF